MKTDHLEIDSPFIREWRKRERARLNYHRIRTQRTLFLVWCIGGWSVAVWLWFQL